MNFSVPTRRRFLAKGACGLGAIALAHLIAKDSLAGPADGSTANPLAPKTPPLPPTAKNVIFLFMSGGPSQLDLFDPKPELRKWPRKGTARFANQTPEAGIRKAERIRHGEPGCLTEVGENLEERTCLNLAGL